MSHCFMIGGGKTEDSKVTSEKSYENHIPTAENSKVPLNSDKQYRVMVIAQKDTSPKAWCTYKIVNNSIQDKSSDNFRDYDYPRERISNYCKIQNSTLYPFGTEESYNGWTFHVLVVEVGGNE